jgi:pimeloyl-ACP methyl ester carboxylesterase
VNNDEVGDVPTDLDQEDRLTRFEERAKWPMAAAAVNGIVIHLGISMVGTTRPVRVWPARWTPRSSWADRSRPRSTGTPGCCSSVWTESSATRWASTSAPAPGNWPQRSALSRCVRRFLAAFGAFSLRSSLDQDTDAPMLVVNGADDVHVPAHDTVVFEGRRDTEVHLILDTGHCATSKLPEAIGLMVGWLQRTLETLGAPPAAEPLAEVSLAAE